MMNYGDFSERFFRKVLFAFDAKGRLYICCYKPSLIQSWVFVYSLNIIIFYHMVQIRFCYDCVDRETFRKVGFSLYQLTVSSLQEQHEFFEHYVNGLSARYDDFLEYHILNSTIYSVHIDGIHSGYFGIYDNNMLTQFFMPVWAYKHAQAVFSEVLKEYEIKHAFVPTCDETFLSLCLDKHCKVNLQAYFFEESHKPVRSPEYPREMLQLAELSDLGEIKQITGDFVDKHEERIKDKQLYILREHGTFLGLGIMVNNIIMKYCRGTGMFTNEKFRQKGVGRSIILHLKDICHENGFIPLPGCWYYNHNSKRTLESAGYISKTRLLKIDFE
jgi:GNAT superfamily N-acetyltransferase